MKKTNDIRAGDTVMHKGKLHKVLTEVDDDVIYIFARPAIQVEKSKCQFVSRDWRKKPAA